MTIVSQALLASALCGEKDRVGVHEEHEQHALNSMAHAVTDETRSLMRIGQDASNELMGGRDPEKLAELAADMQRGAGKLAHRLNHAVGSPDRQLATAVA